MRHHNLKIEPKYHERILLKQKHFEVRFNDRDYQVGDVITFETAKRWHIIYIHSGLGMQPNYVVLGIKEVEGEKKESFNDFEKDNNK